MVVDPPSGWKYGFPRVYDRPDNAEETIEEWYIRHGYPKSEIDWGALNHVRSWFVDEEDGGSHDGRQGSG